MRIESFVVDARDPVALAAWWAEALGWVVSSRTHDPVEVHLTEVIETDGRSRRPHLSFVGDGDPDGGQERIHLDLNSTSLEDQQATVDRLRRMGATAADVGQTGDEPWVVLADPEGNHLCVLEPRPEHAHRGRLAVAVLAAHDASALRDVWAAATGWRVTRDESDVVTLTPPDGGFPLEIVSRPTLARSTAKDRIHVDVAPGPDEDQRAVVETLLALGATPADVGQTGDEPWVVLADPEGNELCVLTPRP